MKNNEFNISVGKKLYDARKSLKMSRAELGEKIGLHETTIKRYEDGDIKSLGLDKLKQFASALEIDSGYLMGWEEQSFDVFSIPGIMPLKTKKVPLLGTIAAGKPILAEENEEDYIECENGINADFCLKIKGESMSPRIKDGDIVFIHSQPDVENGEIAAVIIDDEATLKRVYKKGDSIQLIAENPDYDPIICNSDNCENIQILGRAIALRRSLK